MCMGDKTSQIAQQNIMYDYEVELCSDLYKQNRFYH